MCPGFRPRSIIFLLVALLALGAVAMPPAPARAAGLLIADGGAGGVLEIQEHEVRVTINNGIAVTEVTQVFFNTENRIVEALYTFPVPRNASVANFSMWIDGKEMTGEVLEKARAREIYNSYKQVRRDPGLLEQTDYRSFEMRIFPIAPRTQQKVQVSYYQELDIDDNRATYVYPLASSTRPGVNARTTGKLAFNLEVKSEVPITAMASPSHGEGFAVARHSENFYQASLETAGGELNRDFVIAYDLARPHSGLDLIASRSEGEDGYFCITLSPGHDLPERNQPTDFVFVLDISGSMAQDNKLAVSASAAQAYLRVLGEQDRFEVMAFNVQATPLFGQLQSAEEQNLARARTFLQQQSARGGTSLLPTLQSACRYSDGQRPLNIVILSDGLTQQTERSALLAAAAGRPAGVRFFCIGVGNDVDRGLLSGLAQDARGLAAFVSQGDDLARQAQAFRQKLRRPLASDLALTFTGGDVYDLEPQRLPDLYHGTPLKVYGRYRQAGPAALTFRAQIDGQLVEQRIDLTLPERDQDNPEIERMWAWHRIDSLLQQADRNDGRSAVIPEIVRLGEGYSIVSEYTSFIVLENDAEYQRWKIERKNALRIRRDRTAQQALARKLEQMRSASAREVGPVAPAPVANQSDPSASAPGAAPTSANNPGNGRNVDLNIGGGGGGAIDPFAALLIVSVVLLALISRCRCSRKTPAQLHKAFPGR